MDNDNSVNQEKLDDDIMQCRADILKSRKRSTPEVTVNQDTPAAEVAGGSEKTVKIPPFHELVPPQKQVVDGQWQEPSQDKPEIKIDPANVVTAEEEAALFPVTESETTDQQCEPELETASEEGLDALRKVVELANSEASSEIEELDDIEGLGEMMACDIAEILAGENEPGDTATDDLETESIPEQSPAGTSAIPKFNLAEKILTEQRNVASKRRQRPVAARTINVMPIAGTVGKIIEQAKKAVAESAQKMNDEQRQSQPATKIIYDKIEVEQIEEEVEVDKIEIDKIEVGEIEVNEIEIDDIEVDEIEIDEIEVGEIEVENVPENDLQPVLSVAACRIVNDSDRLNPFQEDIITDIVSRDIAQFCGEFENV